MKKKTKRFEWFLSSGQSKATLIEIFDDTDGALVKVENLMSSTIAPEWVDRFELESLAVLGEPSETLRIALSDMAPDIRAFAGGFTKP